MGRTKGDGLGKFGGRKKGVPNKLKPAKASLKETTENYFIRRERICEQTGEKIIASDFELDCAQLLPAERISAHLRAAKYTMPELKAVDVDLAADINTDINIEQLLENLCKDS